MKMTIAVASLALLLGACAGAQSTKELDDTIASAEKEIAAAKKLNYLWYRTDDMLKDAIKLKGEGKIDEALKKAKTAKEFAILAQKQAAAEANSKMEFPK